MSQNIESTPDFIVAIAHPGLVCDRCGDGTDSLYRRYGEVDPLVCPVCVEVLRALKEDGG